MLSNHQHQSSVFFQPAGAVHFLEPPFHENFEGFGMRKQPVAAALGFASSAVADLEQLFLERGVASIFLSPVSLSSMIWPHLNASQPCPCFDPRVRHLETPSIFHLSLVTYPLPSV